MKQIWTLADESTREKILNIEKERALSHRHAGIFLGIFYYFIGAIIILLFQCLSIPAYEQDILGYSSTNPPQYMGDQSPLSLLHTDPQSFLETLDSSYPDSKEEFEEQQKQEIASAQKQARILSFRSSLPYYLGGLLIDIIFVILYIAYYWSIYHDTLDEPIYIAHASCIQREKHRYRSSCSYSVTLKFEDHDEAESYKVSSSDYSDAKPDKLLTISSFSPDGNSLDAIYTLV